MNEAAVEEETMQSEEQVPTQGQATAGVLLRQAREAARMQLPVMAATLKVPQHKLQALEADDYAAFPDHVFMRALPLWLRERPKAQVLLVGGNGVSYGSKPPGNDTW